LGEDSSASPAPERAETPAPAAVTATPEPVRNPSLARVSEVASTSFSNLDELDPERAKRREELRMKKEAEKKAREEEQKKEEEEMQRRKEEREKRQAELKAKREARKAAFDAEMKAAEERRLAEEKAKEEARLREELKKQEEERKKELKRQKEEQRKRQEAIYTKDRRVKRCAFPVIQKMKMVDLLDEKGLVQCDDLRDHFLQEGRLEIDVAMYIIQTATEVMQKEPALLRLPVRAPSF